VTTRTWTPPPIGRTFYVAILGAAVLYALQILLISAANGTLGFDYRAYDLAVDRLLAGGSMYDADAQATGGFGLFFYPPPFALLILPVALLPTDLAVWVWTILLAAASVAGIALLPISARARWITLLLAALSWPLVYAIKLGQVGPMLLLLYTVGWRWMDRPWRLGLSSGIGAIIKLQPALLIGWAAVTGRRTAALIALGVVAALALVGTLVAGPQAWLDEASLLGRVSRPIETEHAFGVGRLAFEAGFAYTAATAIHWANFALIAIAVVISLLGRSAVASYLAVVIASQFMSPVLWDHYALILLLPVAWLIDRGRWWAVLIPLATSTPLLLVNVGAAVVYPIVFWVTLVAVVLEGLRERRPSSAAAPRPVIA
jgi:hypothetical protein